MRTHYCGDLNKTHIGETVTVCGWAHRRRDHGGVIFIDLRDREGIVQIVIDPDTKETFATAESIRNEFVLKVICKVRARPEGTVNLNIPTGEVELLASAIEILNPSLTPPFMLDDDSISEMIRLEYRFMDLRRPMMQNNLRLRYRVAKVLRDFLDENGFMEIETPMLTRSTPEGARDYLVPSRTHEHHFFALPQSPQLFKQLLMVAGFDRYYQIAKCFRDEDLRADRQPEFTQIDIETSFMDEAGIMAVTENMIVNLFKDVINVDLGKLPQMPFSEAISKYGVDKPDLRIPLEMVTVSDLMREVDFKVFSGPASDPKGRVAALKVPQGATLLTRKQIDDYTKFVSIYGAKGLAYIKVNDSNDLEEGLQSPIVKFLPIEVRKALLERVGAETGDIIFFGADKTPWS